MALLSRQATRQAAPRRAMVAPRRTTVAVRASLIGDLTDQVAKAFVTIFSPARDTLKDYSGTENSFVGSNLRTQGRRPFKDGYDAGARGRPAKPSTIRGYVAPPTPPAAAPTSGYLEGAVGRVMGHQFTGDKATEPIRGGTAVEGWKGSTRARGKNGMHASK